MKIKKNILTTLIALAFLSLGLAGNALCQDKVMIGEPNWANARGIAHIIKVVITEKLGGKAETVTSTNVVIFKGMDRSKGDIDVHPDVWLPNYKGLVDEYVVEKKTVTLNKTPYPGTGGFCVPTYVVKENGIKSVFDLATPEAAKLFDRDGNGKGEIWIGSQAWNATKLRTVKLRDYGIDQFYEGTTEDEAFAYAGVGNAIKKKEAVCFACYTPHYMFNLYDLTILEEPPYDPEKYKFVQPNQSDDWFAQSSVKTADPSKVSHVAYSKSLETRAPGIARFLANIQLKGETVNEMTHAILVDKIEPADWAAEWVKKNGDTVDKWLGLK